MPSSGGAQEQQQLQQPAEAVARLAAGHRRLRPGPGATVAAADVRPVPAGRPVAPPGGERAGQRGDRGVPVDVLDRDGGQVGALAQPGAELGHQHRVGARGRRRSGCRCGTSAILSTSASTAASPPASPATAAGGPGRRPGRAGRPVAERGGQRGDGGVPVDVLDRDGGQVGALAQPGAELGHQHASRRPRSSKKWLSTGIVGDLQHLGQHGGQVAGQPARRGGAAGAARPRAVGWWSGAPPTGAAVRPGAGIGRTAGAGVAPGRDAAGAGRCG